MFKLLPEEYLYFKGGGNGAMIAMMMQMNQQAAEAKAAEQVRNDKADALSRQTAQEAKDKLALDKQTSASKVGNAYDSALAAGKARLGTKGIDTVNDPYGIMSMFTSSLDRARAGAPEVVADPNAIFSTTLLDDALSEARSTQRTKYGSQIKNNFGDDYGLKSFGSTADDSILESILGTQKQEAITNLDRALARGTINEVGRSAADRELANMFTSGLAKANSLGDTVLGGYRSQLDGQVGKIRDKAGNWDFGDTFNYDNEAAGLDTLKTSLSGKLNGDILNAISGQNFFDNDILLGKGGSASGVTNPGISNNAPGILNAITGSADRTKDTPNNGRKLNALDEVF